MGLPCWGGWLYTVQPMHLPADGVEVAAGGKRGERDVKSAHRKCVSGHCHAVATEQLHVGLAAAARPSRAAVQGTSACAQPVARQARRSDCGFLSTRQQAIRRDKRGDHSRDRGDGARDCGQHNAAGHQGAQQVVQAGGGSRLSRQGVGQHGHGSSGHAGSHSLLLGSGAAEAGWGCGARPVRTSSACHDTAVLQPQVCTAAAV